MITRHLNADGSTTSQAEGSRCASDRNRTGRLRRPFVGGVLVLMLALAACGSSDSDDASERGDTSDDETTQPGGATDAPAGGTGEGRIEIGDVSYDLEVNRCVTMFSAVSGDATAVSEPDNVEVSFDFSPEDWAERDASEGWSENGSVRLDVEDPYTQWVTGNSVLEGYNAPDGVDLNALDITSYDISDDGQSITGEAQFIELNAMLSGTATEPTAGTFSFSCPPSS